MDNSRAYGNCRAYAKVIGREALPSNEIRSELNLRRSSGKASRPASAYVHDGAADAAAAAGDDRHLPRQVEAVLHGRRSSTGARATARPRWVGSVRRHREADLETGAASGRAGCGRSSEVGCCDLRERWRDPTPRRSSWARAIEPHEPLEDPLPFRRGDAAAVVIDAKHDVAVLVLGEADRDARPSVARRVVHEVADHPPQLGRIASHSPDTDVASTSKRDVSRTVPRLLEHEVVHVDRAPSWREGALVCAGQQQEVLDEVLQPEVLGQHGLRQLVDGRRRSGWAMATSACWRMLATGERSSWDASDTKRRSRTCDSSRRPSMRFIVAASREISSCPDGCGTRRRSVADEISSTSA